MEKDTKVCALKVSLLNNVSVQGDFHVGIRTSSAIRPSDAIREITDKFLVLTNAIVVDNGTSTQHAVIMIPLPAISFIELSGSGWAQRKLP
ncbi:MAG: hypothetical protein HY287_04580 [Planctomycetes bacterium]|nr:hypothetical protein [Planctomycetota bacterium]MBI3833590.1 hypothetical protein [Planctomycetota bacterium]